MQQEFIHSLTFALQWVRIAILSYRNFSYNERQGDMSIFLETEADPSQMHPVEYLEPLESVRDQYDAAEFCEKLFDAFYDFKGAGGATYFQTAFRRFVAITGLVRPDLLRGLSQIKIGEALNCTSANVSKLSYQMARRLGIEGANHQSEEGRQNRREGQLTKSSTPKSPPRLSHAESVKLACESAKAKVGTRNYWSKFEVQSLRESGLIDEDDLPTSKGKTYFESNLSIGAVAYL